MAINKLTTVEFILLFSPVFKSDSIWQEIKGCGRLSIPVLYFACSNLTLAVYAVLESKESDRLLFSRDGWSELESRLTLRR